MNSGAPTEVDVAGGVPGTAGFGTGSADGGGLEIGRDVSATTARAGGSGRCGLGAVCFGASASRADSAAARTGLSVGVAAVGTGSGARIGGVTSPGTDWVASRSSGTGVSVLADWARLGFAAAGDGASGQPASARLSMSGAEEAPNPGVPAKVDVAGKSAGPPGAGAGGGTEEGRAALNGVLAECVADRLPRVRAAGPGGEERAGLVARTDAAGLGRIRLMSAPRVSRGAFARRRKAKTTTAWRTSEEEKAKPIASSGTRRSLGARLTGE
jgi:hypothetical protein